MHVIHATEHSRMPRSILDSFYRKFNKYNFLLTHQFISCLMCLHIVFEIDGNLLLCIVFFDTLMHIYARLCMIQTRYFTLTHEAGAKKMGFVQHLLFFFKSKS